MTYLLVAVAAYILGRRSGFRAGAEGERKRWAWVVEERLR